MPGPSARLGEGRLHCCDPCGGKTGGVAFDRKFASLHGLRFVRFSPFARNRNRRRCHVVAEFSPCAGLVARLEINGHRVNLPHFHMYSDEHISAIEAGFGAGLPREAVGQTSPIRIYWFICFRPGGLDGWAVRDRVDLSA
jgi:hypothetical protein